MTDQMAKDQTDAKPLQASQKCDGQQIADEVAGKDPGYRLVDPIHEMNSPGAIGQGALSRVLTENLWQYEKDEQQRVA